MGMETASLPLFPDDAVDTFNREREMGLRFDHYQLAAIIDDRAKRAETIAFEGLHWRSICCGAE